MRHPLRTRPQRGFTLLELLIAIGIFAFVGAIAYGGLAAVMNSQERIKAQSLRMAELQKAFAILERDLEQMVDRPIRDEFGDTAPAMKGGPQSSPLIEFTRTGRANPQGLRRSALLRVGYRLDEGRLLRLTWPALDRPPESQPLENPLLTKVSEVEFRYIDGKGKPHPSWPPPPTGSEPGGPPIGPLPAAIEMKLVLEDWGEITRLLMIQGS